MIYILLFWANLLVGNEAHIFVFHLQVTKESWHFGYDPWIAEMNMPAGTHIDHFDFYRVYYPREQLQNKP